LVKATDFKTEPISWVFVLEKVAEPSAGPVPSEALFLDFEREYHIIDKAGTLPGELETISSIPLLHQEFEVFNPADGKTLRVKFEQEVYTESEPEEGETEQITDYDSYVLRRYGF